MTGRHDVRSGWRKMLVMTGVTGVGHCANETRADWKDDAYICEHLRAENKGDLVAVAGENMIVESESKSGG